MDKSLQEQLLKAGLIDAKKAKQVNKEKAKQKKQQKSGNAPKQDEVKQAALDAQRLKAEKDRQLNAERNAHAHKKAIEAQIKQLIAQHQQTPEPGDIQFNFKVGTTIKQMRVSPLTHKKLLGGVFCIAQWDGKFYLLPEVIATKIAERDQGYIVYQAQLDEEQMEEDDPYADYKIPDDLMW